MLRGTVRGIPVSGRGVVVVVEVVVVVCRGGVVGVEDETSCGLVEVGRGGESSSHEGARTGPSPLVLSCSDSVRACWVPFPFPLVWVWVLL